MQSNASGEIMWLQKLNFNLFFICWIRVWQIRVVTGLDWYCANIVCADVILHKDSTAKLLIAITKDPVPLSMKPLDSCANHFIVGCVEALDSPDSKAVRYASVIRLVFLIKPLWCMVRCQAKYLSYSLKHLRFEKGNWKMKLNNKEEAEESVFFHVIHIVYKKG